MSSNSINKNNNIETSKISKINTLEESKVESYVLRKQIYCQIPNCFVQKEFDNVPSNSIVPKQNIKSQNEELQKLLIEIDHMEEKVGKLQQLKKLKQFKVGELRKIIERIADEDSFDTNYNCVFNSRMPGRLMQRERCPKASQTAENYHQQTKQCRNEAQYKGREDSTGSCSCPSSCFEADGGDDSAAGGAKISSYISGKSFIRNLHCNSSCCYLCSSNTMDNSLLFWQEHLQQPKGILKQ